MTDIPLTTAQVARLLGIAQSTVTWRVRQGRLTPAVVLPGPNGQFLFDRAEIEAMAEKDKTK